MQWAKAHISGFWYEFTEQEFNAPLPDISLTFGVEGATLFNDDAEVKSKAEWTTNRGLPVPENWTESFLYSDVLPKFTDTPADRSKTVLTNRIGPYTEAWLRGLKSADMRWDTLQTYLARIKTILAPYLGELKLGQISRIEGYALLENDSLGDDNGVLRYDNGISSITTEGIV
jgi:hypothetical protein